MALQLMRAKNSPPTIYWAKSSTLLFFVPNSAHFQCVFFPSLYLLNVSLYLYFITTYLCSYCISTMTTPHLINISMSPHFYCWSPFHGSGLHITSASVVLMISCALYTGTNSFSLYVKIFHRLPDIILYVPHFYFSPLHSPRFLLSNSLLFFPY